MYRQLKENIFSLAILFACSLSAVAQTSVIDGRAPAYKGQEVALYSFSDLITYTQTKEAFDTVDQKGVFELKTKVEHPQAFRVKIGNQSGKIYMLENYKYGIIFPELLDSSNYQNPNAEQSIDLIINSDSTELNARIIDFNVQFEKFWVKNYKYFVAKKIQTRLDSFELKMEKRYADVNSTYLKTYIRYTFALMNDNIGRHRNYIAYKYVLNKPIAYDHYEYMEFFNQYFKSYLQQLSVGKFGNDILDNINEQPDYVLLNETLKKDLLLSSSDSLRELVLLKGLYELYYTPGFKKENIIVLVDQAKAKTKNKDHIKIADNILRLFRNLQNGVVAPDFRLKDAKGNEHSLSEFNDRYIYLDFFSPNSLQSMQEMKKLEEIKNKYNGKVIFISICMDGTEEEFKEFVKKNPKYNWLLLYGAAERSVLDAYMVKAPALYYLINREGFLVQSPASAPSEGIELKFKEMFKVKHR